MKAEIQEGWQVGPKIKSQNFPFETLIAYHKQYSHCAVDSSSNMFLLITYQFSQL